MAIFVYEERTEAFMAVRDWSHLPKKFRVGLPYVQTCTYALPDLLIVRGGCDDNIAEWDITPLDGSPEMDLYDEVRIANSRGGTDIVRVWVIPGTGKWLLGASRYGGFAHIYRIIEIEDNGYDNYSASFYRRPDEVFIMED